MRRSRSPRAVGWLAGSSFRYTFLCSKTHLLQTEVGLLIRPPLTSTVGSQSKLKSKSMKWNSFLLILLFPWLIIGCRTQPTSEPFAPPTSETAQPIPPPPTATSRPTTTVVPTEILQKPAVAHDIAATVI